MALTREEVVSTAVALLDEVGLDALTLRRLAKRLNISAPTLYWHVRDKRDLLDLMAEKMIITQRAKEPPLPPALDFFGRAEELFRRQYHALIAYRDGPRVMAGNRPTSTMLPEIESWLGTWTQAGFPAGEALTLIVTIGNFVMGSALEYQAEADRAQRKSELDAEVWRTMAAPDVSGLPNLGQAFADHTSSKRSHHDGFEAGLKLITDGIRARHAELGAGKASGAVRRQ